MASLGTNAIVEIQIQLLSGDAPRDWIVHHLTFNTAATAPAPGDWQSLVNTVLTQFTTSAGTRWAYPSSAVTVKAYDRFDLKPRPEKAVALYAPGSWLPAVGFPRQVALCLSFFSGRNLKRQRGRVYLCPTNVGEAIAARPSAGIMGLALQQGVTLNTAVGALTPAWIHTVHSDKDDQDWPIDNYWVNDESTIRSRGWL